MKRTLPLLLALIASPLAAFIPFTNNVRTGPAAFPQYNPAIASNGFEYLAAWIEPRPNGSGVYTARIEADGTVNGPVERAIDPAGPFLDKETHPRALSLTPGRDGYFLAWVADDGLHAAITDSYGAIERRVTLPETQTHSAQTLAAWNGNTYLVLSGFVPTFTATLLDNNGQVMKSQVAVGDTHSDPRVRTALVADGEGFLVVSTKPFDDRTEIYGRRISSSGALGDWFLIRSTATQTLSLSVAFDGSHDVVVWGDEVGLWTIPIDAQTNAIGQSRQWVSGPLYQLGDALWAFNRLWIGYSLSADWISRYLTISADGTASTPVEFDSMSMPPRFAGNSSRILSIRGVFAGKTAASFASVASHEGDFQVAYSQTLQQNGALATDGKTLLAVWDEIVAPDRRIYASVIDTAHFDQTREVQVTAGATDSAPVVSFNGTEYLIVWTRAGANNENTIIGRRVSSNGSLLEGEIAIGSGSQPRVTSDGMNWMVVWQQVPSGTGCPFGSGVKLLAARIAPTGSVLDGGGIVIAPGSPYDQADADVTWSGSQYVVAWSERCTAWHQASLTAISAATVSADLSHIVASMVTGPTWPEYGGVFPYTPKTAATKDRILIAWNSTSSQSPYTTIEYRIFGASIVMTGGRQRSAALRSDTNRVHGTLIALGHDPAGQFFILGRMVIPTASAYDGLYRWNIDDAGTATNIGLRFAFSTDERLMGTPVLLGQSWWMAESRFLPDAGAYRLYARDFN